MRRTPLFRDSIISKSFSGSDGSIGTARVVKTSLAPQLHSQARSQQQSHSQQKARSQSQSQSNPQSTSDRTSTISDPHQISRLSDISTISAKPSERSTAGPSSRRTSRQSELSTDPAFRPQIPSRTASRLVGQNAFRHDSGPRQNVDSRLSFLSSSTINTISEDQAMKIMNRQSSTSSQQPSLDRQESTKIMRVTRQEETLLAAMRLKKANMRRTILTEAYHTALEEEEAAAVALNSTIGKRPKTSDETRQSIGESILELDKIGIPSPPRPRTAEGRQSVGPDFIATTPHAAPSTSQRSQSDVTSSYRDSMIRSDRADTLPSPSTSRASPVTPTMPHHLPPPPSLPLLPATKYSHPEPFKQNMSLDTIDAGIEKKFTSPPPTIHKIRPLPFYRPPPSRPPPPLPSKQVIAIQKPYTVNEKSTSISIESEKSLFDAVDDAAEEAVNLDDFPIWAKGWNENQRQSVTVMP